MKNKSCGILILIMAACVVLIVILTKLQPKSTPTEDKAIKIATWIQEEVNIGGYTGCQTRVISPGDPGGVQCDLHWPAGTSTMTVKINTKGVAEKFAQAGRLAATIWFAGYSGVQKVCEYTYDPYSGTVK